MAAHARLKTEFMEDKKYHNLMSWLLIGKKTPELFVNLKVHVVFMQKAFTALRPYTCSIGCYGSFIAT